MFRKPHPDQDYIEQPYLEGWEPLPERQWAERFIDEDGNEDFQGFLKEFRARHPFLQHNHGDTYVPASVDYYVRHDATGVPRDIDWEIATLPLTDKAKDAMKAAREARVEERRMAVLRKRGLVEAPVDQVARVAAGKPSKSKQQEAVAANLE